MPAMVMLENKNFVVVLADADAGFNLILGVVKGFAQLGDCGGKFRGDAIDAIGDQLVTLALRLDPTPSIPARR